MFSKAVEAAEQSFGKLREWIKPRQETDREDGTENSGASAETGFADQKLNRINETAGDERYLYENIFEQATEIEGYVADEIYSRDETMISCGAGAGVNAIRGSFNEQFQNELSIKLSSEMAEDNLVFTGCLLRPPRSKSNPDMDRPKRTDENLIIQRSITPDARYFGRQQPNSSRHLNVPLINRQRDNSHKRKPPSICDSISNSSSYERRVSNCSITKIKLAIMSTDNQDKNRSPRKYSVFIEELAVNSCTEEVLETYDEDLICGSNINSGVNDDQPLLQNKTGPKMSPRGPVAGIVKVSLQFFEKSRMLRIIVLRATNLKARKGYIYAKISAHYVVTEKEKEVLKLSKVKANSEVAFNEQFFLEDVDTEDKDGLVLSFKLYKKEGIFRSKKCLGEMVIPAFKYDLSMDTSIKGTLRENRVDEKDLVAFDDTGDLEIISEDRSIAASVAASLNLPNGYRSPRFRRMNSLPAKLTHGTRQDEYKGVSEK